jgi:DNA-binding transcriptional ArsR family regulator
MTETDSTTATDAVRSAANASTDSVTAVEAESTDATDVNVEGRNVTDGNATTELGDRTVNGTYEVGTDAERSFDGVSEAVTAGKDSTSNVTETVENGSETLGDGAASATNLTPTGTENVETLANETAENGTDAVAGTVEDLSVNETVENAPDRVQSTASAVTSTATLENATASETGGSVSWTVERIGDSVAGTRETVDGSTDEVRRPVEVGDARVDRLEERTVGTDDEVAANATSLDASTGQAVSETSTDTRAGATSMTDGVGETPATLASVRSSETERAGDLGPDAPSRTATDTSRDRGTVRSHGSVGSLEVPTMTEPAAERAGVAAPAGPSRDSSGAVGAHSLSTDGRRVPVSGDGLRGMAGGATATLLAVIVGMSAAQASFLAAPAVNAISMHSVSLEPIRGTVRARMPSLSPRRWIPFPGYSRYDDSDPLEHDTRRAIYDYVTENPGAPREQVSAATGTPTSTVRYHRRILEEEGLLDSEQRMGERRLYPETARDRALAAALNDDAARIVIEAVRRHEPASTSEVADAVDRAPSTTSRHLSRLEDAELIVRERDGMAVRARLSDEARSAYAAQHITVSEDGETVPRASLESDD